MRILGMLTLSVAMVLAGAASGATYDYRGAGGSLNVSGNWYNVTSANKLDGGGTPTAALPSSADAALVRNGTTVTVNNSLSAWKLYVGGYEYLTGGTVLPVIHKPTTTARIVDGAQITLGSDGAFKVGNRIGLLEKGKIIAEGTPAELMNSTEPAVRRFIDATKISG